MKKKKKVNYTFSKLVAVLHWPKSVQLEASPQDSSYLIYTRLLQHCKPMRGVSNQTHNYASPFLFTSNNAPAFQNWVSGGMGEIFPHTADVGHSADGLFWPSLCLGALTWWKDLQLHPVSAAMTEVLQSSWDTWPVLSHPLLHWDLSREQTALSSR